MGIAITCDFCGNTNKSFHRIFVYDLEDPDTKSTYCACEDCLQKHLLANIKHIAPPVVAAEPSATFTQAFQGMALRDFLRTNYYLDDFTTTFIFQKANGETIENLQTWLGKPIVKVSRRNENREIIVMVAEHNV